MRQPLVWDHPDSSPLHYWSREQLLELWAETGQLKDVANACRLNAVTAIQRAGSGHLGTSLSSLDIMIAARRFLGGETFLEGAVKESVFFSSKGHDAPAYYATMHACGQLEDSDLFTLRQMGGLPGHPETITPGVPTNTGSLGMGISKAKGFIRAQRLRNPDSRDPVVVVLGDGELNEGQIWESMPGAVRDGYSELIAIVDGNQIQSDTWTDATLPMGDLRARVEGVGWSYTECDGNNPDQVLEALETARATAAPSFIYASTVKGSGIPWMEQFPDKGEYYKFHSGALAPELYNDAVEHLVSLIPGAPPQADSAGLDPARPEFDSFTPRSRPETLLTLWEDMLPVLMKNNPSVVVLDGDLSYDTGTHLARHAFPERYIQAGIAEQDMVSMAGTLALSGFRPLVHSFATFLTMRATEQIFNNATEYTPVVYLGFLAGLVPSAPGFSHQAVTDVGIMLSIPGMRVFEPSCRAELEWAVSEALSSDGPSYLRMGTLSPLESVSGDASESSLHKRREGSDVALVTSGPLLGQEALGAADLLSEEGVSVAVFTKPELGAALTNSDAQVLAGYKAVVTLENFMPALAHRHHLMEALSDASGITVGHRGIDGVPANGQPAEVLRHHGLDAASISTLVRELNS